MCYTHKNASDKKDDESFLARIELMKKALFKCPLGRDPKDCDGHVCPSRAEPPFNDYYSECVGYLYARMILKKSRDRGSYER